MRTFIAKFLNTLAKSIQPNAIKKQWQFPTFNFTPRKSSEVDLLEEVRGTAYACASMNASACAYYAPKLFKKNSKSNGAIEIFEHPLLDLFKQVNPVHNAHDLWELTTFDQEIFGSAYWLIDEDIQTGIPVAIWPLPAHKVKPVREVDSSSPVDWYEIRRGGNVERIMPSRIIHFRYPDPRDPYGAGLSPLRACQESASLQALLLATKKSLWENHAMPGVILSPTEPMHEEERDRLETLWNHRFKNGGNGRVLVADTGMKVETISASLADATAIAESGATRDDIANAFGVPLSFLTRETNLANLQAAERQHWTKTIRPRLRRRDEKLNEQLMPRFDSTGKYFLETPEPKHWK